MLDTQPWRRGAPPHSAPLYAAMALTLAACNVQDVDRTQPDKVQKCMFFQEGCDSTLSFAERTPTEFYYNQTVIDVPATSDVAFVGDTNFQVTNRVVFDIQEDMLYVYRAFPWIEAAKDGQGNGGDEQTRPGSTGPTGAPIAIFPIKSHFDVQRQYNPATGEQTNVIEENTSDRPWYQREYMRVDWSDNRVGDINFTMSTVKGAASRVVPQDDDSRDLGKERTQIGPDYIDFVQHVALEASTVPGSEAWFGYPIPTCWLYSKMHTDCQGGVVKVRNSFARVQPSNYRPAEYSDTRLNKFGAFRTERYTYDDEYGVVEPTVKRLANRWNILKPGADCYQPEAELPYGTCKASDLRTIVYHVAEEHPAHLKDAALALSDAWDAVFKRAVADATNLTEADLAGSRLVRVCVNNPVLEGDPAECGEPGLNPQIGDIRYSFIYYVPEEHESSPLGFGPTNVDPTTGEILRRRLLLRRPQPLAGPPHPGPVQGAGGLARQGGHRERRRGPRPAPVPRRAQPAPEGAAAPRHGQGPRGARPQPGGGEGPAPAAAGRERRGPARRARGQAGAPEGERAGRAGGDRGDAPGLRPGRGGGAGGRGLRVGRHHLELPVPRLLRPVRQAAGLLAAGPRRPAHPPRRGVPGGALPGAVQRDQGALPEGRRAG
ncbi:MAG: hypothetical protein H6730_02105 [Deltaproteobacteria bacterium]|nr:hypothetical protein [Deltaproteobacteria bacterium]